MSGEEGFASPRNVAGADLGRKTARLSKHQGADHDALVLERLDVHCPLPEWKILHVHGETPVFKLRF